MALKCKYHNSLQWIRGNDHVDLDLTFAVDGESLGQTITTELKPGGADIHLTNENKREYIELVNEWRFINNVIKQMYSFIEGFTSPPQESYYGCLMKIKLSCC